MLRRLPVPHPTDTPCPSPTHVRSPLSELAGQPRIPHRAEARSLVLARDTHFNDLVSLDARGPDLADAALEQPFSHRRARRPLPRAADRKSTRLNSSH